MRTRLTYLQARILLVVLGIGVSVGQTLLAWDRGAAPTEVMAPLLYIPVFVGAIFWFLPGGIVAAAAASGVYAILLADQSAVVGLSTFIGLLITRISIYFLFGVVVGLGVRYVESRLRKLEVYDQIDDSTGLYNSAFFLESIDLEMGRAARYRTLFSVAGLDVRVEAFDGLGRRRQRRLVRDLAVQLEDSIRTVDRAIHFNDTGRDRFLVILPETGVEGSRVFTDRLRDAASAFLTERGAAVDGNVSALSATFPEEPELMNALREEARRVEDRRRALDEER